MVRAIVLVSALIFGAVADGVGHQDSLKPQDPDDKDV
jgi:hypothetical protein